MKSFYLCIILLFSVTHLFSDTIIPSSGDRHALEERLKKRKLRLDSTLKSTDAFMDSITGKTDGEMDTLIMMYNYDMLKKREAEERIYQWVKIGGLLLLIILGVAAYVYRKKRMG